MERTVFKGIGTALVTPFTENGIDFVSLGRIIEYQLSNGIDALIVCGTTGEASTMSYDERDEVIDFTVKQVRGRVPVIAGTGSNNTRSAIGMTERALKAGASAVLAVTPYYNKTTKSGLIKHFSEIASVGGRVIIYNVPSRTGVNITPEDYCRLAEIENTVGVKEANGNITAFARSAALCGDKLDFYAGNDEQLLPALSLGGSGVISASSNVIPKEMKKIYSAFADGDFIKAYGLQKKITRFEEIMFTETNPVPVKTALSVMGYCRPIFRLPLSEAEAKTADQIEKELILLGKA